MPTLAPEVRKQIAERLKSEIDAYCVKTFTDDYRHHLGMSVIGEDCYRKIWYMFRWVKFGVFDGRMLRLFDRGHKEEPRFEQWLTGVGAKVWAIDPETGQQYKLSGLNGHYGGSLDRMVILPWLPDTKLLGEFKTHNEKNFTNLMNKGVAISQPKHYTQMCSYGKYYGCEYGLYCAVDKNDDDLYFEVVELNWGMADSSLVKAEEIIRATEAPPRISPNPSYYKCKSLCSFTDICHHGAAVEVNCRSCKNATPVEDANWFCSLYQQNIPKDHLPKGCKDHVAIG